MRSRVRRRLRHGKKGVNLRFVLSLDFQIGVDHLGTWPAKSRFLNRPLSPLQMENIIQALSNFVQTSMVIDANLYTVAVSVSVMRCRS